MFFVGFLLIAAPVVFVAFLALAAETVVATKSRERKAADVEARVMLTDGTSDNAGELIRENRRQGSSVVRVCVILGFVLTGSMLYLPPLAWLVSYFGVDSNPARSLHELVLPLCAAPYRSVRPPCVPVCLRRNAFREEEG